MKGLFPLLAGLLAAALTYSMNWLALKPWRRSVGLHWSERARLLYPARVAARSNLWTLPALATFIAYLLWPDSTLPWIATGAVAMIGAMAGSMPLEHDLYPDTPLQLLVRETFQNSLLRFLQWFALIGAILVMPDNFEWRTWATGGAVLALWLAWSKRLANRVWLKLRWVELAPERLQKIVADTSVRMNLPCPEVLIVRSPIANAAALTSSRRLLFTDGLLAACTDEEISAICAHEMGHLMESRSVRTIRASRSLMFLPWIFIRPLLHTHGQAAFFGLVAFTLLVPRIFGRMSRKLETRADQIATANESDAGVYARALTRIYEVNQIPAVMPRARATHPNLYDRIVASGVTPDFPRPLPPRKMAAHGTIVALLLGGVVGFAMAHANWR